MCKKYRQFHTLFLLLGLEEALEMKHNLPKMMQKSGPNTRSSACDTKETVSSTLVASTIYTQFYFSWFYNRCLWSILLYVIGIHVNIRYFCYYSFFKYWYIHTVTVDWF